MNTVEQDLKYQCVEFIAQNLVLLYPALAVSSLSIVLMAFVHVFLSLAIHFFAAIYFFCRILVFGC